MAAWRAQYPIHFAALVVHGNGLHRRFRRGTETEVKRQAIQGFQPARINLQRLLLREFPRSWLGTQVHFQAQLLQLEPLQKLVDQFRLRGLDVLGGISRDRARATIPGYSAKRSEEHTSELQSHLNL